MGERNVVMNEFLSDRARFADLINAGIFKGRQIVKPEELTELDTSARRYEREGKKNRYYEYTRDQLKCWKCGNSQIVFGIEPEESVQYALPIKYLKYDSIQYQRNYRDIAKEHRKKKDLSSEVFISQFTHADRLMPVITLGVYCGDRKWEAPRSLHEILDLECLPAGIKEYVESCCPDYPVNLLDINELVTSDIFVTDLREVFGFLMRKDNKEELKRYVSENEYFRYMPEDAYHVITVLSGMKKLEIKKEDNQTEGGVDMCNALEEMMQEARMEGMQLGRKQGIERGVLKINQLNARLASEGRVQDIIRAAGDLEFQKELCERYGI